jgi:hypothetical protein
MLKMIEQTVPVGLEAYYTPMETGGYQLQVDGVVPVAEVESLKQKVKEFRDTNTTLLKDNEKFKSFSNVFGSENVSAEKLQEKIDALAAARVGTLTESMKTTYEAKVSELSDKLSKAGSKLSELTLGNEVVKAAGEHGVTSTALEDVIVRAKAAFNVTEEGVVKFKEEKLDSAGKPYTVASWMQEVKSKAPHLFAPSQGTGATRPSRSSGKTVNDNRSALDRMSAGLSQFNNPVSIKKLT